MKNTTKKPKEFKIRKTRKMKQIYNILKEEGQSFEEWVESIKNTPIFPNNNFVSY